MSTDDIKEDDSEEEFSPEGEPSARERLEESADRAIESFDEGVIDLLSWLLDTDTRARIYVYLRQNPNSTSKEVANGTGLYPSTVREALAELHDEETVTRQKRQSEGAGNNPYEYSAIPPSDLVGNVVGQIQNELNAVFTLDSRLGDDDEEEVDEEPVTITVQEHDEEADDAESDDAEADAAESEE